MRMGMRTGTSPRPRPFPFVRSPSIFRARGDGGDGDGDTAPSLPSLLLILLFLLFLPSSSSLLSQPHDPRACDWVSSACSKSASEAATSARRWLLDATRDENLPALARSRAPLTRRPNFRARRALRGRPAPRASPHTMLSAANMAAVAIDPRATTRRRRRERALRAAVVGDAFAAATRAGTVYLRRRRRERAVRALRETHGEGSSVARACRGGGGVDPRGVRGRGRGGVAGGAAGGSEDDDDEKRFGAAGVGRRPSPRATRRWCGTRWSRRASPRRGRRAGSETVRMVGRRR